MIESHIDISGIRTASPGTTDSPLFIQTLRALFSQNSEAARLFSRRYTQTSLQEALAQVENDPPVDVTVEGLERWRSKETSSAAILLTRLVAALPPQEVARGVGGDLLLWAALNYCIIDDNQERMRKHLEKTGIHSGDLEMARASAWQLCHYSDSCVQIISQYKVMQALRRNDPGTGDIARLVNEHRLPSGDLSPERVAGYSLEPIFLERPDYTSISFAHGKDHRWRGKLCQHGKGKKAFEIYMDSPGGLLLLYKQVPQAIVAFHVGRDLSFFINQVQGLRGFLCDEDDRAIGAQDSKPIMTSPRGLATLRWDELMVHLASNFALSMGFESLTIQGAVNNKWP